MRAVALGLTLFALVPKPVAAADALQKVVPEDLFHLALVDDAQISSDGKQVAFVVKRADGARDRYTTTIYVTPSDGSSPARQVTRGPGDSQPNWSPDGKTLAFVSTRDQKQQIYLLDLARGGEARQVTRAKNGAREPRWSHDGRRILYLGVERDEPVKTRVDWHAAGTATPEKLAKSDVRTIDRLRFETNGLGYTYDRRVHLWVMNADGSQHKQLTYGRYAQTNPRWSPDDATIAYNAYEAPPPRTFRQDLYTIPSGGGTPTKLPLSHLRQQLVGWSADGKRLWFVTASVRDGAALPGLAGANVDGSDERQLVAENEVTFGDRLLADLKEGGEGCIVPSGDGKWILADASVPGATALLRIDASTGVTATLVGGPREISACSLSADGPKIAYVAGDGTHPDEVFAYDVTAGASLKISGLNDAWVASHALAPLERHTAKNSKGQDVEYWVMRPPDAVEGRRYPLLIDIHGGPQTEFGNAFFHELQVWVARGYVVAFGNPRGSVGYGYAWTRELEGNWGDPMFDDVSAITDDAVKRPDVDATRVGVSGGSYGGYATLWIVGHTTRFKAAIAERVVSDLFSEQLGSDFAGSQPGIYSWGEPWTNPMVYWKQSPIAYVRNVRTPLLILHSDNDTRTPVDQTYEEYSALKILERPVWLIEVPRDNHDLSRVGEPIHRVERLHILIDWLSARV